jgi:hypothetical protein
MMDWNKSSSFSIHLVEACALGDQRKSSDSQRQQAELNALQCVRQVDVREGDFVSQIANLQRQLSRAQFAE